MRQPLQLDVPVLGSGMPTAADHWHLQDCPPNRTWQLAGALNHCPFHVTYQSDHCARKSACRVHRGTDRMFSHAQHRHYSNSDHRPSKVLWTVTLRYLLVPQLVTIADNKRDLNIKRFVPPERINCEVEDGKCECDNFELSHW